MPTPTVENYLKQIYLLSQDRESGKVSMGILSARMAVAPGTATSMVKSMQREDWLTYEPRIGVRLTEAGLAEALGVLRKHRIVEMFLVQVLGLDWSEVHEEAELLEHAMTDKLVDRMDDHLGNPEIDPHGDPIPNAKGRIKERKTIPLNEGTPGKTVEVARIVQQDGEFLTFLNEHGLVPGARLRILSKEPRADTTEVELDSGKRQTLGGTVAAHIQVIPSR